MSFFSFQNNRRGFTLIELLVVISIIGLLSSVVLASLSSARSKGVIGAGLQFDAHTYHAFGADATTLFNFDEGVGTATQDMSQYGNIASFLGTTAFTVANGGIDKYGVSFPGNASSYMRVTSAKGEPITNNYTVSAWIKPSTVTASDHQTLVYWGNLSCATHDVAIIYLNGNHLSFTQWCNDQSSNNSILTANTWAHVVVSVNGTTANLYQNGKLIDTLTINNVTPAQSTNLYIGGNPDYNSGSRFFSGVIDSVRIYPRSFQVGEIEKLYVEGLRIHSLAENK